MHHFSVQQKSQSRPVTPNSESSTSTATKLPSLAMERIKIQTTAAFDRMSIMQKRYHEHQEALRSTSDLSRHPSNASQFEDSNVSWICAMRVFCRPCSTFCPFVLLCDVCAKFNSISICHTRPSGKLTIEIHRHDLHALAHALDRAVCRMTTRINLKMEIIVSITNHLPSPTLATHRTTVPIHEHDR